MNVLTEKNKNTINNMAFFTVLFICFLGVFRFQKGIGGGVAFSSIKTTLISLLIIGALIILPIVIFYKREWKIEKIFLVIAIVLGGIFMCILPPLQAPDEEVHMIRAYDLANGRIFFKGNENSLVLPSSMREYREKVGLNRIAFNADQKIIENDYEDAKKIQLDKERVEKYNPTKTEAYLSLAYLPQATGMFIGDLLNLPFHYVFYLGRITNFLVWLGLSYMALKIIPIKKELLMFVMLLPMSVQQAVSVVPDALLNSCSFLLVAYILYLRFVKEKVDKKDVIVICSLCIGIVAVKLPYMLISALIFIVPKDKFGNGAILKKIGVFILVLVLGFSTFISWNIVSKESTPLNKQQIIEETESSSAGYVYTAKQILENPVKFAHVVKNTIKEKGEFYIQTFVARFGWIETIAPQKLVWVGIIIIVLLALFGADSFKLNWWDRVVFLCIGTGMFIVLCVITFMWDGADFNNTTVCNGIQGRYFIPFCMPFLLTFYQQKVKIDLKKLQWLVPLLSVFMITFSLSVIYVRYWI